MMPNTVFAYAMRPQTFHPPQHECSISFGKDHHHSVVVRTLWWAHVHSTQLVTFDSSPQFLASAEWKTQSLVAVSQAFTSKTLPWLMIKVDI